MGLTSPPNRTTIRPTVGISGGFLAVMLAVEFLDEFNFGANEAAWPLIRDDLLLTYAQIGILLSIPRLISNLVEPTIGILADVWKRRVLILGGGIVFTFSLVMISQSTGYIFLLLAFCMFGPASGAFVSVSQATMMDADSRRHEQNMARWTFAGSLGVVAGPLALGAAVWVGYGWRQLYILFALLAVALIIRLRRYPLDRVNISHSIDTEKQPGIIDGFRTAMGALRQKEVLRWLVLLEFSDLMLDVLLGFLALYFVDVAGFSSS